MVYGQPTGIDQLKLFLRIASAHMDVQVPKDIVSEMERTNKKKPPGKTSIQIMFSSRDENDASSNDNAIIKDLTPFPDQGRIFIGFPTHQTTGISTHIAGRFIPTVERENIE